MPTDIDPATDPQADPATDPSADPAGDPKTEKQQEAMVKKAYADRLLREKKAAEDELKLLKTEKEEREQAEAKARGEHEKIAETERKKREALEQKIETDKQTARVRDFKRELRVQAAQAGILDVDDVALIDITDAAWDEDGEPSNAAELLAAFKAAKPGKFKTAGSGDTDPEPKTQGSLPAAPVVKQQSKGTPDYSDRKKYPDIDAVKDEWKNRNVRHAKA